MGPTDNHQNVVYGQFARAEDPKPWMKNCWKFWEKAWDISLNECARAILKQQLRDRKPL